MIGNTRDNGKHFGGLMYYLSDPQKMEWRKTQNVDGKEPREVAKEMQLTAGLSDRVEKPVYHISISWHRHDAPTKDQMIEVADDFLKHMELDEHQAVIVAHSDTDNPHIHIAANRVHPETEKAWELWKWEGKGSDRKLVKTHHQRVEEFLRGQEKQYGWEVDRGKHAGEWERNFDSKAPEIWEIKQGTRIEQEAQQLGLSDVEGQSIHQRATAIKDQLYRAQSFQEFDHILATKGLWIEDKGQGAIITDGTYSKKASSVSRGLSGNKLEDRFGQDLKEYVASRDVNVDIGEGFQIIDDWATLQERSQLEERKYLTDIEYSRAAGELHRLEKYSKGLTAVQKEIRGSFTQAFENGKQAYINFGDHVKTVGFEEAQADLVATPERFGHVADKSAIVRAAEAIRSFDNLQGRYSTQIVNMSKDERTKRIKTLKSKTRSHKATLSNISHRLMDKGLRESEAGRATSTSVHQVIAVHRALTKIAKNPSQSPIALAKEAGMSMISKADSQAGRAVSNMVMNGTKYFKNLSELLSNPAGGSVKLAKNVLQSAIKQAGKASRDRGRGL